MPTVLRSRSDLDLSKIDWRQADAASEAGAARHAQDPDAAPIFTTDEILVASTRVTPEETEDVRSCERGLGCPKRRSRPVSASRSPSSANTKATAAS